MRIAHAITLVVLLGGCGPELPARSTASILSSDQCQASPTNVVKVCHATGSATNPYVLITVSEQGCENGHANHDGDLVVPNSCTSAEQCCPHPPPSTPDAGISEPDAGTSDPDAGTGGPEASGCVPRPSGMLSWWPGDGNANDVVGPNDGAISPGTSYVPGVVGQAFQFDGITGAVTAGSGGLPTGSADRTIEGWVRMDAFAPGAWEAAFFGYGAFGSCSESYELGSHDPGSFFSQWGDALFGPSLGFGTWHHLAATNVGSLATLYVDGVAVGTKTMTIDTAAGTPFLMGRIIPSAPYCIVGPGDGRRLLGAVDEVAVYDRALSAEEIAAIYAAGSAGKCH